MTDRVTFSMIRYFHGDLRRIAHALKVTAYARLIGHGEELPQKEQQILELAALLHDIGIHEAEKKYGSAAGNFQELEGPPIAEEMLRAWDAAPEVISRVCFLVGHHHTYGAIDRPDFQALVEADFLVNLEEDKMSLQAVETVGAKYFRTSAGRELLAAMWPEAVFEK